VPLARFSSWLGFDRAMIRQLTAADRERVEWLALGLWLSCCTACAPFGYLIWLGAGPSRATLALTVGLTLAGFMLLLAILRLGVAGGGSAAGETQASPARAPQIVLAVAGALAAQPAQLVVSRAESAAQVAARRERLSEEHAASLRRAHADAAGASAPEALLAAYRAELAGCEFVGLRLQHVWSQPAGAVRSTLLFVGLVLLPSALGYALAAGALRRYERLKLAAARAVEAHDAAVTAQSVRSLLAVYPTYRAQPSAPGSRTSPRAGST